MEPDKGEKLPEDKTHSELPASPAPTEPNKGRWRVPESPEDAEMTQDFWTALTEKSGIIFPLPAPNQTKGRTAKLFHAKKTVEPEERITKQGSRTAKVRHPKQQRSAPVKLRQEDQAKEEPQARKQRGAKVRGVASEATQEPAPPKSNQRASRQGTRTARLREPKSNRPTPVKLRSEAEQAPDPFARKQRGAKVRHKEKAKTPEARKQRNQGDQILRKPGRNAPANPNLRSDPPKKGPEKRKWTAEDVWTPDWIRHHTYSKDDRVKYGRFLDVDRRPDLDQSGKGHARIRYALNDDPQFTTEVGHFWAQQEKEPFLDVAEKLARKHAPHAESFADIEGGPFFIKRFEGQRYICYQKGLRKWWRPKLEAVQLVNTDNMLSGIGENEFDVTFVLHCTKAGPVDIDALFAVTRMAIVIVYPYEWKEGNPDQVGMNEEWLRKITRQHYKEHRVVQGRTQRGVALYEKFG